MNESFSSREANSSRFSMKDWVFFKALGVAEFYWGIRAASVLMFDTEN